MPVPVSYPGVYIEEIPSGVHTITGVATSITAFIGAAPRGPVNDPVSVFSFGEFARMFGGMTSDVLPGTTVPLYSVAFAVNDFFLNGGSQAVIVRVVNETAPAPAPAGAPPGPAAAAAAQIVLAKVAAPDPGAAAPPPPPKGAVTLTAASPGAWGNNLSVVVTTNTKPPDPSKPQTLNPNLFNLKIVETIPGPPSQIVATETFFNLSISPSDPTYVYSYLAQNSQLVVPVNSPQPPPIPTAAPAAGTYNSNGAGQDGAPVSGQQIFASNLADAKQGIFALEKTDLFNILVIPPYQSPMKNTDVSLLVQNAAAYCQQRRAFLLVDPPDSWDNPNAATTFALIETDLSTFRSSSSAPSNAAIFYPRLLKANPLMGNTIQPFFSSGTLAGIFARTDAQRGVWKAPAGIEATLAGATGLSVALNNGDNGQLNEIGVNCLRTFPVIGSIVWGSRTLNGADLLADDYKYIPVRRFVLFLEESLYRGTQWVVFEPNDEPLWASIRLNVGAFMQTLFRQGAFQGSSASQAYFVKCDKETTTQNDINNGIVNILVGFAPLKPAEFVILQIQQIAGAIQT
jgi:phage tail sheath protein FI